VCERARERGVKDGAGEGSLKRSARHCSEEERLAPRKHDDDDDDDDNDKPSNM
jgi:hypothetical protein